MAISSANIGNPFARYGRLQILIWASILGYALLVGYFCGNSPIKALALVIMPVGGFFLIRYPLVPVCLFLLTITAESSLNLIPQMLAIGKPLGLLAIGVYLAHKILKQEAIYYLPIHANFLAFTLYCTLSLAWTASLLPTTIGLIKSVQLLVFFWIIFDLIRNHKDLAKIIHAFCLGAIIPALRMPFVIRENFGHISREIGIKGANQNEVALALGLAIILAIVRLAKAKGSERLLLIGYLPILLLGLILTQSRSGVIGFLLALLILLFRHFKFKYLKQIFLSFFILSALIYTSSKVLPVAKIFQQRVIQDTVESTDPSSERLNIWKVALHSIRKRPLLGSGFHSFADTFQQDSISLFKVKSKGIKKDAHNTILKIVTETGIVGLIWCLSLTFMIIKKIKSIPDPIYKSLGYSIFLVVFVPSLFNSFYHNKTFWLGATVILVLNKLTILEVSQKTMPSPKTT